MKHIIIRNENLFCTNCGTKHILNFPISTSLMLRKTELFTELHSDCLKTWEEPTPDLSKSVQEKAMWWIANGEHGNSSKTMWNCFMGNKDFRINHPYDPDDFSRCYKLLEAVPEWKNELEKLKPLSFSWSNLVDNWDKLTDMYEINVKDGWRNSEEVGMYEFMQPLINDNYCLEQNIKGIEHKCVLKCNNCRNR